MGRERTISVSVRNKKTAEKRKSQARKKRRQGRAERRREGKKTVEARASSRQREITIATHNVRTMAVDGTHGVGRALEVLSAYNDLSCASDSKRPGELASPSGEPRDSWCIAAVRAVGMVRRRAQEELDWP